MTSLLTPNDYELAQADLLEAKRLDANITALVARRNQLLERAHITIESYERQLPGALAMTGNSSMATAAPQFPAEALMHAQNALPPSGPPNGNGG